jgi:membrane protein
MGRVIGLIKSSFRGFFNDQATVLAAAICYNTIFAITPLLLVLIAVVGALYGSEAAREQVLTRVGDLMGQQGQGLVDSLLRNAAKNGLGGSIVGIVTTLVGATSLFNQIKFSLNQVWNVRPVKGVFWRTIKTRLMGFALVLVIALMLLVMLATSTAIAAFSEYISRNLTVPAWVFTGVDLLLTIGLVSVMFALVYKMLPDAIIGWRETWVGAGITATLFAVGKVGLGIYLGRATGFGVYGAAGSLVAVLVWIYYSSSIFLLGAEITQCYAEMYGRAIRPKPWAQEAPAFAAKKVEKRPEEEKPHVPPWRRKHRLA